MKSREKVKITSKKRTQQNKNIIFFALYLPLRCFVPSLLSIQHFGVMDVFSRSYRVTFYVRPGPYHFYTLLGKTEQLFTAGTSLCPLKT